MYKLILVITFAKLCLLFGCLTFIYTFFGFFFFVFSFVETVTFSHLVIIIDTYMQYYIRTIIFWFRNFNLL